MREAFPEYFIRAIIFFDLPTILRCPQSYTAHVCKKDTKEFTGNADSISNLLFYPYRCLPDDIDTVLGNKVHRKMRGCGRMYLQ